MEQQASLLAAALTSGVSEQGKAPRNTGLAPRGREGAPHCRQEGPWPGSAQT